MDCNLARIARARVDKAVDSVRQMHRVDATPVESRLSGNELNPLWKQIAETAGSVTSTLARVMAASNRLTTESVEEVPSSPVRRSLLPGKRVAAPGRAAPRPACQELASCWQTNVPLSRARITGRLQQRKEGLRPGARRSNPTAGSQPELSLIARVSNW